MAESGESFEALVAQLEARARTLEAGNIPLEEALATYEEGAALVERLRALLADAELRVQRLQDDLGEDARLREEEAEPYDAPPAPDDAP